MIAVIVLCNIFALRKLFVVWRIKIIMKTVLTMLRNFQFQWNQCALLSAEGSAQMEMFWTAMVAQSVNAVSNSKELYFTYNSLVIVGLLLAEQVGQLANQFLRLLLF